jgi:hypothetical protein
VSIIRRIWNYFFPPRVTVEILRPATDEEIAFWTTPEAWGESK